MQKKGFYLFWAIVMTNDAIIRHDFTSARDKLNEQKKKTSMSEARLKKS